MSRKIFLSGLVLLVALGVGVVANTLRQGSRQLHVEKVALPAVDAGAAARRLSAAVRLRTISYDDQPDASAAEFLKLHALLKQSFPRTHAALKRETVNQLSLLCTWPGSDPEAAPILLMAHQDVVPVAAGTERDWRAEPFGGVIRDGFVWGRGAWDDKANLFAIFEALEQLVAAGFRPRQTIYIAAGHDEETGGERGAKAIAALLHARGVHLEFVLDEGLLITEGLLKGLDRPLALIGIAEKGYLTLGLTVKMPPGHASMPPAQTAIGELGAALSRLQAQPLPARIRGVPAQMFATLAPEMNGLNRLLFANLWLFGPLVTHEMEKGASSNAMLRSTLAPTVIRAGSKDNMLPSVAEARVNVRILPGDTVEGVIAHVRKVINNEHIVVTPSGHTDAPLPAASSATRGYRLIERTLRESFDDVVVAPGLMIAQSDGRHMAPIADAVYRFSPVRARGEDLPRFHGSNERIPIANHVELIGFYQRLLRLAAATEHIPENTTENTKETVQ